MPEIAGSASHSPVPQVTAPFARIRSAVGVTPEQIVNGVEAGAHGVWMFTMPVAVTGPQVDWQVMVYSQ